MQCADGPFKSTQPLHCWFLHRANQSGFRKFMFLILTEIFYYNEILKLYFNIYYKMNSGVCSSFILLSTRATNFIYYLINTFYFILSIFFSILVKYLVILFCIFLLFYFCLHSFYKKKYFSTLQGKLHKNLESFSYFILFQLSFVLYFLLYYFSFVYIVFIHFFFFSILVQLNYI